MDATKILDAVLFATEAHKGQVRKFADEPYIMHPLRVAKRVAEAVVGEYEAVIIAALLHDVLEDCPHVGPLAIKEKFGDFVLHMVRGLTDSPLSVGNRAARKKIDLARLANSWWEVQTIKCADIIDNVPSIVEHDKDFAPLFIQEKLALIDVLTKADDEIYQEAKDMVEQAASTLGIKDEVC